ncbi:ATP synthase F1 subunit epsilon [bacterium]|nr:ATP synthase F1 subunit epsilon [bacterium]
MKLIKFEIVTPEKIILKEMIQSLTVPTKEGVITVLPKHIPLIGILVPGVAHIKKEDDTLEIFSVSSGFIEVLRDKIVILADTAERADEIDADRAEEARAKAEEAKQRAENESDVDFAAIQANLEKELARVKAAQKWRNLKR